MKPSAAVAAPSGSVVASAGGGPVAAAGAVNKLWTTWKVRRKRGREEVSRMCIDYILYTPPQPVVEGVCGGQCGTDDGDNDDGKRQSGKESGDSSSGDGDSRGSYNGQKDIVASGTPLPSAATSRSTAISRIRPFGIRARAVLDLLPASSVGYDLLPSATYPSDHIAIVADLEIVRADGGQLNH